MHATDPVAWVADAALWCRACAALTYDRRSPYDGLHTITMGNALDSEGNPVSVIFADRLEDVLGEACNRCGAWLHPDDEEDEGAAAAARWEALRAGVALGSFEPHEDGCPFGDGTGSVCTCTG